jgi:hypothetical protein
MLKPDATVHELARLNFSKSAEMKTKEQSSFSY